MKVTRKYKDEFKSLGPPKGGEDVSPSLMLRDLSKPIEGLEAGQDFQANIKGHCRGHECRDDGKHHYDLDIHEFDHKGGGAGKKKKSSRDEVEEAMDKFDKEESEKKSKKEIEDKKSEKAESKK